MARVDKVNFMNQKYFENCNQNLNILFFDDADATKNKFCYLAGNFV